MNDLNQMIQTINTIFGYSIMNSATISNGEGYVTYVAYAKRKGNLAVAMNRMSSVTVRSTNYEMIWNFSVGAVSAAISSNWRTRKVRIIVNDQTEVFTQQGIFSTSVNWWPE
jgi:hypothetical protein